ncbi:hypothetical protein [endosymbiont GvMRE of Glomus versiforme]|uniref:hypothetical protein n=1 Tax=endosymbiont GvMRE of Glomus versiforme TaxID=2039283 RepID=UPI000ED9B806|nr:hypothetical protein [endosymbiont GvMRE of Glomus versiforme]RHZ36613.1 hypothetical protein GvMRE_I2g82 [endosymbiont GvMRE of Glomus versiforme]
MNNQATKTNLSIEEIITNFEHQNEIIIKLLKEYQNHLLMKEKGETISNLPSLENIFQQENQAVDYVNNVILPRIEAGKVEGAIGALGFWDVAIIDFIKQQAITFIGTTLKELVIKGLVDLAKWIMEKAETTIINLYKHASWEEKVLFKNKVQEVFPNCELLKKLQ